MRTISVRINEETYERLLKLAKDQNRSMSSQVAHMIESRLRPTNTVASPSMIQLDERQLQRILDAIGGSDPYQTLFQQPVAA